MATTLAGQVPHLFKCRKAGKSGTTNTTATRKHVNKDDIDHWRKKTHSGSKSLAETLHSLEQWKDDDDTNAEAQALLGDWLDSTLPLELETEEEEEMMGERAQPAAPTPNLKYNNFDDLYNHLAKEEEHCAVNNFLQDLKEQEVLDGGMMQQLTLDVGYANRKFNDPIVTMEVRHQQVRENRATRESGGEEAMRRERQLEERRKRQEARKRQEEMVQQEIVRLRRQREERKGLELLLRRRERLEGQRAARSLQPALPSPTMQEQHQQRSPPVETKPRCKEKNVQIFVHLHSLKSLRRHFSRWYSVVLEQRLRAGMATALCDWRRQLRAWRGWRAVTWAGRNQREVWRTEEELRTENRRCQLAVDSDRRRLMRRCLLEWQLWCRLERDQRELLAQQKETRRKMDALISAATTGQLTSTKMCDTPPEACRKVDFLKPVTTRHSRTPVGSRTSQPQQRVKRRPAALTTRELNQAQQRVEDDDDLTCPKSATLQGGRFEHRHAAQKMIIMQQRKQLKEQQEEIAQLKREKVTSTWKGKAARRTTQQRAPTEPNSLDDSARKDVTPQKSCHPIITAMEERARARAQRKKQIEELQKVKQEEKMAEMKAAEEQKLKEEEMEKAMKREEKRLARMKEEEKRQRMKKQQQLVDEAHQHYNRSLLNWKGLAPWKRLMELRQANTELAQTHHAGSLLRRCTLAWLQSARDSQSEREACADQLHQRLLLRRSLSCWKKLEGWRLLQEERADFFYRAHTLRRFLQALRDHVTRERLLEQECQELAEGHNNRVALWRCFQAWMRLPYLERKEREREQRRERLGRKVIEVLPDFWSRPL
ncbi:coiled-coil domain-containing protein 191 isoform X2 [Dunckerocampus dactyliophorus]|uniref:coiled-coil domain-containing protein 191 isoform X2 n=1 Tax=Dunckerocampus dactyliophorus TaxID=161453 RepID=UPI0024071E85|nr:coiled-coil domain-containing protein 191 isoform X2 [Dunckerocampus dactyliophorus]